MAKETLKKTAFAIAIALLAAQNMNAQEPTQTYDVTKITPAAKAQVDSMDVVIRAYESRYDYVQDTTGVMARVWVDNPSIWKPKVNLGGGYTYSKIQSSWFGTVGLSWDGCGVGRKVVAKEGNKTYVAPAYRMGGGVEFVAAWSEYLNTAYSAGKKYFAPELFGHVDLPLPLFEDKGLRHRLEAIIGVGVHYLEHDTCTREGGYGKLDFNESGEVTGIHVNSHGEADVLKEPEFVTHWGFAPYVGVGLQYSFRFSRKLASRAYVRVMYTLKDGVHADGTIGGFRFDKDTYAHGVHATLGIMLGGRSNHQAPQAK